MSKKKNEMQIILKNLIKLKESEKQYILGFLAGIENAKNDSGEEPPKAS